MLTYETLLAHLRAHDYPSFTALQEAAFTNPDTYDYNKDLFVIGETSSGKTMIPLLLYSAAVEEARAKGEPCPKLLFVVPYRALSAQKMEEIRSFLGDAADDMVIVQSTGEFRQDDAAIQNAQVDCAIIITEKAFKYESRSPGFLSQYDYVVLDEVGLLQSAGRGVRLDFLFAWAAAQKHQSGRPRLIALGTPFFDWSAYVDSYHFSVIRAQQRPVKLEEIAITYTPQGVDTVEGNCSFLKRARLYNRRKLELSLERNPTFGTHCPEIPEDEFCSLRLPARTDETVPCPHTGQPCHKPILVLDGETTNATRYILSNICREHLRQGHQILLFINDRVKVMEFAAMLCEELPEFFHTDLSDEECKRMILEACDLEDDDVFGIMEKDGDEADDTSYYRAFAGGIGFHSAALPHELRSYVEQHFLDSREMKIVCSTETLAFGINSSVDVVIIADLYKREGSEIRPLLLNEYQNYAGRSGRLRKDADVSEINGYVYTLVNRKRTEQWEEMKASIGKPDKLYSLFHAEQEEFLPFFLVNLMPAAHSGTTVAELVETVSVLPHDSVVSREALTEQIEKAVQFLVTNELAVPRTTKMFDEEEEEKTDQQYSLTELGKDMRGLIIGQADFIRLDKALDVCVSKVFDEADRVRFLYYLLSTKHAAQALSNDFDHSDTRISNDEVRQYIRQTRQDAGFDDDWLDDVKDNRLLFVLAAMLAWCEGESPKNLYRRFGVHYALLNRLAEQLAYLIEVAQVLLPKQMERVWNKSKAGWLKFNMDVSIDEFFEAKDERMAQFQCWFIAIFYGINTDIGNELQAFLRAQDNEAATALADEMAVTRVNPEIARRLRRLGIRYRFFEHPPLPDPDNVEMRNNFEDQRRRYIGDIKENLRIPGAGAPYIRAFFEEKFPEVFGG